MPRVRCWVWLLLLAGLTGCHTNPATGRSQVILLSQAQVAAMGDESAPALVQEFGGEVESEALRSYVERIGQSLAAHVEPEYQDIVWHFYTLKSEVINAFALPGGHVFITVGLLSKFENEAQVAGVLGHEIGHVTARHVDERLSQQMLGQGLITIVGASTSSTLINEGAGLLTQGVLLKFNRDQESESDVQGLKYMVQAGYDPYGLYQVLEVLERASGGERPPEILSTHPYPETRLEDVEAALQGPYAETQNNPAYGLYRERFDREARPHF